MKARSELWKDTRLIYVPAAAGYSLLISLGCVRVYFSVKKGGHDCCSKSATENTRRQIDGLNDFPEFSAQICKDLPAN